MPIIILCHTYATKRTRYFTQQVPTLLARQKFMEVSLHKAAYDVCNSKLQLVLQFKCAQCIARLACGNIVSHRALLHQMSSALEIVKPLYCWCGYFFAFRTFIFLIPYIGYSPAG